MFSTEKQCVLVLPLLATYYVVPNVVPPLGCSPVPPLCLFCCVCRRVLAACHVRVLKVKKKINGSFSGGQDTKELHELHGANINVSRAHVPGDVFDTILPTP